MGWIRGAIPRDPAKSGRAATHRLAAPGGAEGVGTAGVRDGAGIVRWVDGGNEEGLGGSFNLLFFSCGCGSFSRHCIVTLDRIPGDFLGNLDHDAFPNLVTLRLL